MTVEPELPPPDDVDPEAPYGRTPQGRPYKRPREWREKTTAAMQRGAAAAAKMSTGGTRKKPAAGTTDYRPAIVGLLAIPAGVLGMLGRVNPAFALDGITLKIHAPAIATAVSDAASTNDMVAQALDKILTMGPYGALLGCLVPLALQFAANHKLIEPQPEIGVMGPAELLAAAGITVPAERQPA